MRMYYAYSENRRLDIFSLYLINYEGEKENAIQKRMEEY